MGGKWSSWDLSRHPSTIQHRGSRINLMHHRAFSTFSASWNQDLLVEWAVPFYSLLLQPLCFSGSNGRAKPGGPQPLRSHLSRYYLCLCCHGYLLSVVLLLLIPSSCSPPSVGQLIDSFIIRCSSLWCRQLSVRTVSLLFPGMHSLPGS